jgi:peptidoglycan/LPS O-acetylase OafA/YrhL
MVQFEHGAGAVSGFLITSTSLRRWGSLPRVNARDFYALRFARIAPLLLLLLIILSTLHAAGLKDFVVSAGAPLRAVPVLFIGVMLAAGVLGALVARFYSEPMNRLLRNYWGDGPGSLGSVIGSGKPT